MCGVKLAVVAYLSSAGALASQSGLPSSFPEDIVQPGEIWVTAASDLLRQTYIASRGAQTVHLTRLERESVLDEWDSIEDEYSVSFFLTAFASRNGGDEIFLAGMKSDGSSIIQSWEANFDSGRHVVVGPGPEPPAIGQPLGAPNLAVGLSGGAGWVPLGQRLPQPTRRTLYEGSAGPFTAMDTDPERRFLLLYDYEDHDVLRLDLTATPPEISVLLDATEHPQLVEVEGIEAREFASTRTWLILRKASNSFARSTQWYTVLVDTQNDGIFDSTEFLTRQDFLASDYATWKDWRLFWKF